jgi:DNA mismatch repair protein MutS2
LLERTLRVLEYFKILDRLENYATSSLGKELVRELEPLTDPAKIKEGLKVTSEAVEVLIQAERPPLGGIHDIRSQVKKASINGILAPAELLEVAATLRASRLMREFLLEKSEALELLSEWGSRLGGFPKLEREFERCIGSSGEILDSASAKLHSLRSQMKVLQSRIRDKLDSIIHSSDNSKYLQELIVTVRNDRYVIPVKQEYRSLFPGIVHDQSASGATLFLEPMSVVEINNQLRIVEAQETEEVTRILSELSGQVKEIGDTLLTSLHILARLDLAFAKGHYSIDIHGVEPVLNFQAEIDLHNARHPLITGKVVPINVVLGKSFDTLVITGPNTGGKTVTLKTIGLLTLMAQSGLHIPASSGSEVAVFNTIFCDIGDEQSIEQSLSTFSSHLTQIVKIIEGAREPSCLVLLDELGAGTDPTEGAALAMSILTHLHQLKVRTVATTHYSELKAFAYQTPGIENASVEFDVQTLKPTYHLLTGIPGSSQAFEIAAKLGLSGPIIEQARNYISTTTIKVEEMLRQIEIDHIKAREDRLITNEARIKGEKFKTQYEVELEKLRQEKTDLVRQAKIEAKEILLEARRESENLLRRLREGRHEELPAIANEARQKITRDIERLEEKSNQEELELRIDPELLKVGQQVRAISLNQVGRILELDNDSAQVQLGIIKVNLPFTDLELVAEQKVQVKYKPRSGNETGLETAKNISAEISLRGMTVDEALYELEKYLDQAILAGLNRLRVIHGKGTGVLRQAVQQYLKENPVVKSVYIAEQNEGGMGATVVELKKGSCE